MGAQFAVACQMCLEEKLMDKFPLPSLKVVGLEGIFGFVILSLILVPMYYIRPGGHSIENTPDALHQMGDNVIIPLAMVGNACSIACFNFCGISVTQQLSASHRMVLDSVRTLVVWAVSLGIGWEEFHLMQLLGFLVLSLGAITYNKIIQIPGFYYPPAEALTNSGSGVVLASERGGGDEGGSELSPTSMLASLVKDETGTHGSLPHSGAFAQT